MAGMRLPVFVSTVLAAVAVRSTVLADAPRGTRPVDLLGAKWPAAWIASPGAEPRASGVYHFRKRITLGQVPARFVVHVSADNGFILFVNGSRAGTGPARGDLDHWRYETYDLAGLLRPGENIIAATVWNYGAWAPMAQMSDQTALIVQGDSDSEEGADTGPSWEAEAEPGLRFLPADPRELNNYYAAPPGEDLDGASFDWDWASPRSKGPWRPAAEVGAGQPGRYPNGYPLGTGSGLNRWLLVPDTLPPMEEGETAIGAVVRTQGADSTKAIPAHSHVRILLDRQTMTTAYPRITVSGGKGAVLRLTYAEALVDGAGKKGNRSEIAGRTIHGLSDSLIADGGDGRVWAPLRWRAWRFAQLDVQTRDEPLAIESLGARYSGYPFVDRASFHASDPMMERIWDVGTRTARMNAHDTYMDCPYWEQLQYVADTRIQALISYVQFGDDRLARQAIDAIDASRTPEGLTLSRYPSALPQVIPPFSLLWIGMLHDFWLYRPDNGFLAERVAHTRGILDWYARHRRQDGLLGLMPWWNFGDWTKDFDFGVPPQDADGGSALLSLDYMAALRDAADLEAYLGNLTVAEDYRRRASVLGNAVRERCWVPERGLLADTPSRGHFSEQTNTMGVLLDVVPADKEQTVMKAVLSHDPGGRVPGEFSRASLYFRFYVARALEHAGLGDMYVGTLGPWKAMLDLGLTTWAETEEPTRSDDHAWSAHPNYDLMTLVAGIHPAAPGFREVLIEPHPGPLTEIAAKMPHPSGEITVQCRSGGVVVELPKGVSGSLKWKGTTSPLKEGINIFVEGGLTPAGP
jgi:alpha-L-rhamnosidase